MLRTRVQSSATVIVVVVDPKTYCRVTGCTCYLLHTVKTRPVRLYENRPIFSWRRFWEPLPPVEEGKKKYERKRYVCVGGGGVGVRNPRRRRKCAEWEGRKGGEELKTPSDPSSAEHVARAREGCVPYIFYVFKSPSVHSHARTHAYICMRNPGCNPTGQADGRHDPRAASFFPCCVFFVFFSLVPHPHGHRAPLRQRG